MIAGGVGGAEGGMIAGNGNSAGDCAGACCGAETACCEAEGAMTNTSWVYTGPGGSYNPVQSYQFVGEGAGTYDKETTTYFYGWRLRRCCLGILGLLLIPLLI